MIKVNKEIDVRDLNCPLPILRVKKALSDMESGEVLRVLTTDPALQHDFSIFAKQTGNQIVDSCMTNEIFSFLLRRR